MARGVGWCSNPACGERYVRHYQQYNEPFYCRRCRKPGLVEVEAGTWDTPPGSDLWREVRVEFDFDPSTRTYRGLAIIRDESVPEPACAYRLRSPLVCTERRALRVAESILGTLGQRSRQDCDIPSSQEAVLDLGASWEEFGRVLGSLAQGWARLR